MPYRVMLMYVLPFRLLSSIAKQLDLNKRNALNGFQARIKSLAQTIVSTFRESPWLVTMNRGANGKPMLRQVAHGCLNGIRASVITFMSRGDSVSAAKLRERRQRCMPKHSTLICNGTNWTCQTIELICISEHFIRNQCLLTTCPLLQSIIQSLIPAPLRLPGKTPVRTQSKHYYSSLIIHTTLPPSSATHPFAAVFNESPTSPCSGEVRAALIKPAVPPAQTKSSQLKPQSL